VSRRRQRAALVGNCALVGVRGRLGVGRHKQGPGKLSRGSERAMDTRWRRPTATRGSPEKRIGRRRRLGLVMLTAREPGVQLEQVQAAALLSRREREIRQARARNTAAARWRPAGARGGHGARKTGQRGRARAAGKVWATRGEGGSRRWIGGGLCSSDGEVLCAGGREQQRCRGAPEEEEGERGGGLGACLEILETPGSS
jgi:hypothetical protein